jgi:hypothetical protein
VYAANTDACDDANACTTADTCKAGACAGALKSCSDGSDCTADSCDVKSGTCSYVLQAACIGKGWQRAIGSAEEDNFYAACRTCNGPPAIVKQHHHPHLPARTTSKRRQEQPNAGPDGRSTSDFRVFSGNRAHPCFTAGKNAIPHRRPPSDPRDDVLSSG